MGGIGYITEFLADIARNNSLINTHMLEAARVNEVQRFFYSSSACIYPEYNQQDPENPKCSEESAYPAAPDSEYGWEKLFSERLYMAFAKNYKLDVHIARYLSLIHI